MDVDGEGYGFVTKIGSDLTAFSVTFTEKSVTWTTTPLGTFDGQEDLLPTVSPKTEEMNTLPVVKEVEDYPEIINKELLPEKYTKI
jgi:hypothetical protein